MTSSFELLILPLTAVESSDTTFQYLQRSVSITVCGDCINRDNLTSRMAPCGMWNFRASIPFSPISMCITCTLIRSMDSSICQRVNN